MAQDNKLLAQDFEKLLSQVSPETQKKLIESSERGFSTVFEQSDDLNFSQEEIEGFRAARDAYFSSQLTTPVTNEASSENEKKREVKEKHEEHSPHAQEEPEQAQNENSNSSESQQERITPEEAIPSSLQNHPEPNIHSTKTAPNVIASQVVPNQFGPAPRQSPGGISYLRRRGQRANRRYGPGGFASSIAKNAAKKGAKKSALWTASWLLANPWIAIAIGVAIAILVGLVILIAAILSACENFWDDPIGNAPLALIGNVTGICNLQDVPTVQVPANPPGVTAEKKGLTRIANGGNITYEITVKYDPTIATIPIDQLSLFDVLLFENEVVSATGTYTRGQGESGFNYVRWSLSQNQQSVEDFEFNFILEVKPTIFDFIAINTAYVATLFKDVTVDNTTSGSATYRIQ